MKAGLGKRACLRIGPAQRAGARYGTHLVAPDSKRIHLGQHVSEELSIGLVELELALGADLGARALQHLRHRLLVVRQRRLDRLPLVLCHRVEEHVTHPKALGLLALWLGGRGARGRHRSLVRRIVRRVRLVRI